MTSNRSEDKNKRYASDYVGVNIKQIDKNIISFSQPALIDTIIKNIGIKLYTMIRYVPVCSSKILHYSTESSNFDGHFHYWSMIGKLNYFAQLTRPGIQFAIHSCAKFSNCAKH